MKIVIMKVFCDVLVDFMYKSEVFFKIIDKKRKISVEDQIKRISKLKFCKEKNHFLILLAILRPFLRLNGHLLKIFMILTKQI